MNSYNFNSYNFNKLQIRIFSYNSQMHIKF